LTLNSTPSRLRSIDYLLLLFLLLQGTDDAKVRFLPKGQSLLLLLLLPWLSMMDCAVCWVGRCDVTCCGPGTRGWAGTVGPADRCGPRMELTASLKQPAGREKL